MSRMFKLWTESEIETINPFNGCKFECYDGNCWAKRMADRLQGNDVQGYENGFEPSWCPWRIEEDVNSDVCWIGINGRFSFPTFRKYL